MTFIAAVALGDLAEAARTDSEQKLIAAGDAGAVHRAVMSAFPQHDGDGGARSHYEVLWRAEPSQDGRILIRSAVEPAGLPATARVRTDLSAPDTGTAIGFTLAISAIHRNSGTGGRSAGASVRPVDSDQLPAWIANKLAGAIDNIGLHDIDRGRVNVTRSKRNFPIDTTRVSGTGTVASQAELARLLQDGVGRERAFGCGLLTVLPIQAG